MSGSYSPLLQAMLMSNQQAPAQTMDTTAPAPGGIAQSSLLNALTPYGQPQQWQTPSIFAQRAPGAPTGGTPGTPPPMPMRSY